ncbi:MAG: hypothetical protein KatS3mg031_2876 [Chitinophagales bacterium]|nr:MAG: hypothetical protein KatS3mg031_2876 [Chitinophagales bacterium]
MKKITITLLLVLSSCAAKRQIVESRVDTVMVRERVIERDTVSIVLRDTVQRIDTIVRQGRASVRLVRVKDTIRVKAECDTIVVRDTVRVTKIVETEKKEPDASKTLALWLILALIVLVVVVRLL